MKALVLEAYNQLTYKSVPDPVLSEDEVLVKVKACGICGSDVHGLDGSTGRRIPPIIMGHEASGEIVETGKDVHKWHKGDRVTFDSTIYRLDDWYTRKGLYNLSDGRMVLGVSTQDYRRDGAFADYVAIPEHIVYHIPEKVSYTHAAMVEPAAVALHAVSLTPDPKNEIGVVIGTGMIGLFLIQLLRIADCRKIIAVDIDDDRLRLASELGANYSLNARNDVFKKIKQISDGRGADLAFDAVGSTDSFLTTVNSVRRGAAVTLVGNLVPNINMPLQKIVTEQIRLQGSCAIAGEYPDVLDMISQGKINVNAVLSNEVPLAEGEEWFQKLYNKEKGLMKVVLVP